MASGSAKAALFDAQASIAQALGSGRRAEIVDLLAQGERPVDAIASEIDQSVANTSQHLQVLARAGLVRSRREGTRIFYRLASERVGELWAAVRVRRRWRSFRPCCRSCPAGGRSSPIAAVRTASTPTTLFAYSVLGV